MNAKHTPGPWHYDTHLMDHADHLNVWEINGVGHIAAVSTGLTPDPSAEANARLIAAAPELLEVLNAINEHWNAGNFSRHERLWEPMRAAIAKATGEAR